MYNEYVQKSGIAKKLIVELHSQVNNAAKDNLNLKQLLAKEKTLLLDEKLAYTEIYTALN